MESWDCSKCKVDRKIIIEKLFSLDKKKKK